MPNVKELVLVTGATSVWGGLQESLEGTLDKSNPFPVALSTGVVSSSRATTRSVPRRSLAVLEHMDLEREDMGDSWEGG